MLGEGLTTAAPVQLMKFDETTFDRSRRPKRRLVKWLVLLGVAVAVAAAFVV